MILSKALCVHGTWIVDGTRINAFTVEALFVIATFIVRSTSQFETAELSVSREARFTATHRMMICDTTFGVHAAIARTNAKLINTRLGQWALGRRFTSSGMGCYRNTKNMCKL